MRRVGNRVLLVVAAGMGLLVSRPVLAGNPEVGGMAPATAPSGMQGMNDGTAAETQPTAGPTTGPTTQTSGISVDQSTPRGALKVFLTADVHGDGEQLKQVLLAENPQQDKLLDAMAQEKEADRDLADALMAKFPNQGVDPRARRDRQLSLILPKMDQLDENIVGDTAMLSSTAAPPGAKPTTFTLKKVGDKWFIPLSTLLRPEGMDRGTEMFGVQTAVLQQGKADVNAGQYSTLNDAARGIAMKIHEAMLQAQTQPTMQSAPATQP